MAEELQKVQKKLEKYEIPNVSLLPLNLYKIQLLEIK